MIDLLSAFAKLAEQMLKVDAFILSLVNGDEGLDTAELTLFCTEYLNQLHDALQIGDSFVQRKDEAEEVSPIWNHASVVRALLLPLETAPGNLTGWMEPLISVLNALVAQSKSHSITLTALTLVMADCLRESKRRLHMSGITPNVQSHIEDTLRRGQGYWHALSITFEHLIEKHISILNIDTAFAFVDGLTTMLEYCCPFDAAFLEDHLQLHPDTPVASLADAAAWEFRLQIFAKLIQSSHMQLRVRAVSTLCSDLIRIWKRRSDNADRETADFLRYLGTRLDDKVVDYVIGPTCHPEIIIESANVLGFLVVTKIYSQKHTDRLWAAILSSQDPRVGDALTRMVLTVCNLLEYETLLELCIKFQHLPLEAFSSTLRSLWESIIRELIAKRQGTQIPLTREPFISCLRMLRESGRAVPGARVANVELHQSATQRLKELLMYGIDQPVRQELYETCIKDLRAKTDKTLGSLWFLSMSIRPCISAELQKLIEKYDLARLLVEELDCAVQTFASTGRPVFSGHANHPRRDLIYNLIQIQPAAISGELSTMLWDLLVGALSRNTEDRVAAWQMLATVGRNSDYQNLFLQACFSQFLPKLPAACVSEGMLEIVKDNVSQLVNDPSTSILEDEELVSASPIEHLWRILLMGEDDSMVSSAIRALTSNVYLESRAIATLPSQRAQEIHVRLADRCLKQMETAARSLRRINDGSPSGDDDSMVFIASEEDTKTQERVFIRSLGILRYFMEAYRAKPQFSVPDMRSLIPKSTSEIKGDLAGLQYQSFDGSKQTDMKPLEIGKQNSAACLLARLRHETGFDNYRAFYRGQHFLPNCDNICKSLEELQINDGLILVKRAASDFNLPPRIRAGLSPLEIKILSHFNDLWEYLGMDEKLAKEVR
jgi:ubiquitin carboxyl-terminal hydrolase 34